ncbi:MAG: ABC transporter permease [Terriglobia bacterium]
MLNVWRRNLDSYRKFYVVSLVGSLGDPLFFLVALGFGLGAFLGNIEGMPYVEFIAPGLVVSSAMFSSAFECTYGSFLRMIYQKTYDAIIATPVEIDEVIAGDILWGASKAVISGSIVALVVLTLGLVDSPAFLLAPLLIFTVGFVFASLAMLTTSVVPNFESFNYFFQLFLAPMFFFSGIFFPLNNFPPAVQTIAQVLPLTHAVSLSRALVSGKFQPGHLIDVLFLISIGLIAFFLSIKLAHKRLVK